MSDQIDNQESMKTPEASQAEIKTDTENEITKNQSVEETEWESLKGSTQDRIRQLIQERNELRERNLKVAENDLTNTNQGYQNSDDEVGRAVEQLKQRGVATKEDLQAIILRMEWERKHDLLANKYNGKDGLPKYDRVEVEDYARKHSIGNPEAAFRDMYWDEFMDSSRSKNSSSVYTEKPNAAANVNRQEPLTIDAIRAKLRSENGREFYDTISKDPAAFDKLLQELSRE